jgi:hypothetical protein
MGFFMSFGEHNKLSKIRLGKQANDSGQLIIKVECASLIF